MRGLVGWCGCSAGCGFAVRGAAEDSGTDRDEDYITFGFPVTIACGEERWLVADACGDRRWQRIWRS